MIWIPIMAAICPPSMDGVWAQRTSAFSPDSENLSQEARPISSPPESPDFSSVPSNAG